MSKRKNRKIVEQSAAVETTDAVAPATLGEQPEAVDTPNVTVSDGGELPVGPLSIGAQTLKGPALDTIKRKIMNNPGVMEYLDTEQVLQVAVDAYDPASNGSKSALKDLAHQVCLATLREIKAVVKEESVLYSAAGPEVPTEVDLPAEPEATVEPEVGVVPEPEQKPVGPPSITMAVQLVRTAVADEWERKFNVKFSSRRAVEKIRAFARDSKISDSTDPDYWRRVAAAFLRENFGYDLRELTTDHEKSLHGYSGASVMYQNFGDEPMSVLYSLRDKLGWGYKVPKIPENWKELDFEDVVVLTDSLINHVQRYDPLLVELEKAVRHTGIVTTYNRDFMVLPQSPFIQKAEEAYKQRLMLDQQQVYRGILEAKNDDLALIIEDATDTAVAFEAEASYWKGAFHSYVTPDGQWINWKAIEEQKVEEALAAHRKTFVQGPRKLKRGIAYFKGQYAKAPVYDKETGTFNVADIPLRRVTIRPTTLRDRARLDTFRRTAQTQNGNPVTAPKLKVWHNDPPAAYKADGKSPLQRAMGQYSTYVHIENLNPGRRLAADLNATTIPGVKAIFGAAWYLISVFIWLTVQRFIPALVVATDQHVVKHIGIIANALHTYMTETIEQRKAKARDRGVRVDVPQVGASAIYEALSKVGARVGKEDADPATYTPPTADQVDNELGVPFEFTVPTPAAILTKDPRIETRIGLYGDAAANDNDGNYYVLLTENRGVRKSRDFEDILHHHLSNWRNHGITLIDTDKLIRAWRGMVKQIGVDRELHTVNLLPLTPLSRELASGLYMDLLSSDLPVALVQYDARNTDRALFTESFPYSPPVGMKSPTLKAWAQDVFSAVPNVPWLNATKVYPVVDSTDTTKVTHVGFSTFWHVSEIMPRPSIPMETLLSEGRDKIALAGSMDDVRKYAQEHNIMLPLNTAAVRM